MLNLPFRRPHGNSVWRRLLAIGLCAGLGVFGALGPIAPSGPAAAQDNAAPRGVPYITQRARTGIMEPDRYYGAERGTMTAGSCSIAERRIDVLTPLAENAPFYIPDEFLRVDAIKEVGLSTILDSLARSAAGRTPVLYTHGFFIDFEKGCRRATVLQENAGLEGRFVWFTWPSDGSLTNYTHDEADLHWSVLDIADTIAILEGRFGRGRLNLVGHSLGGRGQVLALYDIAARHPDVRIGHVALLAPDIDFDLFRRMLPRIRPMVSSITIYVAGADRPLALSQTVHGYPRLGQTGNDVARLAGVEVIDISDLPVRSASGHNYHIYNPEVGADLAQLLTGNLRAAERRNLIRVGENLWRLQPDP